MDEQELERLAERYADMIYRIALNDTRSPTDAEDILQEVLLALFTAAPAFESSEHEKRWLIRVTLNKGRNHRRSLLRRATLPLEEADGYLSREPDREPELLAEGPWELSFVRRYPDATRAVPVNDLIITDQSGQRCHIRTLSCSCLGLTITGTIPHAEPDAGPTLDLTASVILKDGSVLPLQTGFSAEHSNYSSVWSFDCHARVRDQDGFGLLDPDHIAAVTLCGVTIPVP